MAADIGNEVKYYKDRELSPEAKEKIKAILAEERKKARAKTASAVKAVRS